MLKKTDVKVKRCDIQSEYLVVTGWTDLERELICCLLRMVGQHCSDKNDNGIRCYSSDFLSANKYAFDILIELGILKGDDMVAYLVVDDDEHYLRFE